MLLELLEVVYVLIIKICFLLSIRPIIKRSNETVLCFCWTLLRISARIFEYIYPQLVILRVTTTL